jgi:hypothetical protein
MTAKEKYCDEKEEGFYYIARHERYVKDLSFINKEYNFNEV